MGYDMKSIYQLRTYTGPTAVKEVAEGLTKEGFTVNLIGTEYVYVQEVAESWEQAFDQSENRRSPKLAWLRFKPWDKEYYHWL